MLKPFDDALAEALQQSLPNLKLKPAEARYLEEPRGKYSAHPTFVAAPLSTDMVAEVVSFAGSARFGIQPYGGGTGLVGGQVTPEGPTPLILSLENLNAIREVYPSEQALIAEAGATISDIQAAAEDLGLLFPLSYGSQDSAQIGAGLSVNSGGLNVLRYGMARNLCLGIEAVLRWHCPSWLEASAERQHRLRPSQLADWCRGHARRHHCGFTEACCEAGARRDRLSGGFRPGRRA